VVVDPFYGAGGIVVRRGHAGAGRSAVGRENEADHPAGLGYMAIPDPRLRISALSHTVSPNLITYQRVARVGARHLDLLTAAIT
jgi:hypothetical protein